MKEKQNQNDKNKNGLIFESNTHPFPNFVTDDGRTLKMFKGNSKLQQYITILRHTIGFHKDSTYLSNSTIAEKTGIDLRQVKRINQELKKKLKLIDFESCQGGRAIKNIKILLPERFYSKEVENELDEIKKLEAKGYTVIPPSKKGDKPVLNSKESYSKDSVISEWNKFVVWSKSKLTRSSQNEIDKLEKEIDGSLLILKGNTSEFLKEIIRKYFSEQSKLNIIIHFKEGEK